MKKDQTAHLHCLIIISFKYPMFIYKGYPTFIYRFVISTLRSFTIPGYFTEYELYGQIVSTLIRFVLPDCPVVPAPVMTILSPFSRSIVSMAIFLAI